MEQEELKTMTIGTEDDPMFVLCPGHVTADVFNKAREAEGWEADPVLEEDLNREYWAKTGENYWERVEASHPDAKPYTVESWN